MRRDIFQALADPKRRVIIMMLAAQSMTPNAIAEHFKTSRQAVSKHLQILSECDVISGEKEGREIVYSINSEKMEELETWIMEFKNILNQQFSQLDEVLSQLQKNKK